MKETFIIKMNSNKDLDGFYEVFDTIGSGSFSKVKLGEHILTGQKVAIKIMDKEFLGHEVGRVTTEIVAMTMLHHQNICELYQAIETSTKFYLILEHCPGGELFDYLISRERLTEDLARYFFRQIVSAVAYIHQMGYVHRDLKPENLLLDEDSNLKLIDFGLCIRPKNGIDSLLDTCCGSPAYAAPELLNGQPYVGKEADLWSLGVLLYSLLCGYLPFDDENTIILYKKIQNCEYELPRSLSRGSASLVERLLQVDVNKRATMQELIHDPWLLAPNLHAPLAWQSIYQVDKSLTLDMECITLMALHFNEDESSMQKIIRTSSCPYLSATYQILINRKNKNLELNLNKNLNCKSSVEAVMASSFKNSSHLQNNCNITNKRGVTNSKKFFENQKTDFSTDVNGLNYATKHNRNIAHNLVANAEPKYKISKMKKKKIAAKLVTGIGNEHANYPEELMSGRAKECGDGKAVSGYTTNYVDRWMSDQQNYINKSSLQPAVMERNDEKEYTCNPCNLRRSKKGCFTRHAAVMEAEEEFQFVSFPIFNNNINLDRCSLNSDPLSNKVRGRRERKQLTTPSNSITGKSIKSHLRSADKNNENFDSNINNYTENIIRSAAFILENTDGNHNYKNQNDFRRIDSILYPHLNCPNISHNSTDLPLENCTDADTSPSLSPEESSSEMLGSINSLNTSYSNSDTVDPNCLNNFSSFDPTISDKLNYKSAVAFSATINSDNLKMDSANHPSTDCRSRIKSDSSGSTLVQNQSPCVDKGSWKRVDLKSVANRSAAKQKWFNDILNGEGSNIQSPNYRPIRPDIDKGNTNEINVKSFASRRTADQNFGWTFDEESIYAMERRKSSVKSRVEHRSSRCRRRQQVAVLHRSVRNGRVQCNGGKNTLKKSRHRVDSKEKKRNSVRDDPIRNCVDHLETEIIEKDEVSGNNIDKELNLSNEESKSTFMSSLKKYVNNFLSNLTQSNQS